MANDSDEEEREEERRVEEMLAALDAPTMPDDNTVARMFVELMDALALPGAAANKMIQTLPTDKKWEMIKQNAAQLKDDVAKTATKWGPEDHAALSAIECAGVPSVDDIQTLRNKLRQSNKGKIRAFIKDKGVAVLTHTLYRRLRSRPRTDLDGAVCTEILECFKALMNNKKGMEAVLKQPGTIEAIAFCIDFRWLGLSNLILEILMVTCFYSREGCQQVNDAVVRLSRRRLETPYFLLMDAFKMRVTGGVASKTSILRFINVLIQCTPELEARTMVRNQFLSLEFVRLAHKELAYEQHKVDKAMAASEGGAAEEKSAVHPTLLRGRSSVDENDDTSAIAKSMVEMTYPGAMSTGLHARDDTESNYAQDPDFPNMGLVPIDPAKGIMAGVCVALKDRGKNTQALIGAVSKATKHRWYQIDNENFSWWARDKRDKAVDGQIPLTEIIGVRPESTNEKIYEETPFAFDVVTNDRAYNLGVQTEEDRIRWTTALTVAYNDALLSQANYKIDTVLHLMTDEVQDYLASFKKELEVFERLAAMDHNMSRIDVTDRRKAGNPDRMLQADDLMDVMKFLADEVKNTGLTEDIVKVIHQLSLLPMDRDFGALAWSTLSQCINDIRSNKHRGGYRIEFDRLQKLIDKRRDLDQKLEDAKSINDVLAAKDKEIADLRSNSANNSSAAAQQMSAQTSAPSAPVPVPIKDDPKYTKYFKMLKMHLPKPAVAMKCTADGVDPAILDLDPNSPSPSGLMKDAENNVSSAPAPAPPGPGGNPLAAMLANRASPAAAAPAPAASTAATGGAKLKDDPKYAKYFKMLKMHLPPQAVKNKMEAEGLDPAIIDMDPEGPPPAAAPAATDGVPLKDDPKYAKFFKMLKMHLPPQAVKNKMEAEGLDSAILDMDPEKPAPSAPPLKDDPKYAKFFKMLKMHLPPQAVKNKMSAEGLDPAVLDMDPEKPAPAGAGGAKPKPAAFMLRKRGPTKSGLDRKALEEIGLKEKPKIKLESKLKQVFWTKVPVAKLEGTMWVDQPDDLTEEELEASKVVEAFGSKPSAAPKAKSTAPPKPKLVTIIDPKRSQAVSIGLGRFKYSYEEFHDIFVRLDQQILTPETTEKLLAILPTDEEFSSVNEYEGELSLLGKTEAFFRSVGKIPRLIQRIECMSTSLSFAIGSDKFTGFDELVMRVENLEQAIEQLEASESFRKVLRIILSYGNYLNGGSARGQAYGFDLAFLKNIVTIKTKDGKKNLMHFIADAAERMCPEVTKINEELSAIDLNTRTSLGDTQKDLKNLGKLVGKVETEIKSGCGASEEPQLSGPFNELMEPFVEYGKGEISKLEERLQAADASIKGIASSYSFKTSENGDTAQELFQLLSKFISDFTSAFEKNVADREKAARDERLKKATEERNAARKASLKPGPGGAVKLPGLGAALKKPDEKKDLFAQFEESRKADAATIVAEMASRMKGLRKASAGSDDEYSDDEGN